VSLYLIDTNILSEPIKPQPNAIVITAMQRYTEAIAISAVTWHEIQFGCHRLPPSRKRTNLEQYLREVLIAFPILPYTDEAATWHATERTRLTAIGQSPAFADGQIAAIAHVNNLILVTNNVSDFAGFQNLRIENWFTVQSL
jgi:tRNA(fMet)-specific endonuclease VapC